MFRTPDWGQAQHEAPVCYSQQLRQPGGIGMNSSVWDCRRCCGWSSTRPRSATGPRLCAKRRSQQLRQSETRAKKI